MVKKRRNFSHSKTVEKSPGEKKRPLLAAVPKLTVTVAMQVGRRTLQASSADAPASHCDISQEDHLHSSFMIPSEGLGIIK